MKFKYLAVFCVLYLSDVAFADGENEMKGMHPFMGFIYYSDESVVDSNGNRFLRGAVLVTPGWLVTSAVQISDNVNDVGFPRKTLLARFGAIAIDSKFTLNEDEDEQEREVVQIVRPYNHSATQWWRTDITLMQALLPFNITNAVKPIQRPLPSRIEKTQCFILIYAKRYANATEERVLTQATVDLLPSSLQNCGSHFFEDTMICANDVEEKNEFFDPPTFCQGNSGGPLSCDGNPVALQTYINNNCKSPHLYQLFSPWQKFIDCAVDDKCNDRDCTDVCIITTKDAPLTLETTTLTISTTSEAFVTQKFTTTTISVDTTPETTETTVDVSTTTSTLQTETTTKEMTEETPETTTPTEVVTTSTMTEESELPPLVQEQEPQPQPAPAPVPVPVPDPTPVPVQPVEAQTISTARIWPKEKEDSKSLAHDEECEDSKRKTNVEAQQDARPNALEEVTPAHKRHRSAAQRNMSLFQSVFCAIILLSFL